jgi:hypothetical protein
LKYTNGRVFVHVLVKCKCDEICKYTNRRIYHPTIIIRVLTRVCVCVCVCVCMYHPINLIGAQLYKPTHINTHIHTQSTYKLSSSHHTQKPAEPW